MATKRHSLRPVPTERMCALATAASTFDFPGWKTPVDEGAWMLETDEPRDHEALSQLRVLHLFAERYGSLRGEVRGYT